VDAGASSLGYFTSHDWQFDNRNLLAIQDQMNQRDRETFDFNLKKINWDRYIEIYILGMKRFILKEEEMITNNKHNRRDGSDEFKWRRIVKTSSFVIICTMIAAKFLLLLRSDQFTKIAIWIFKMALKFSSLLFFHLRSSF
jgi:fatty acyl-CoA reductase